MQNQDLSLKLANKGGNYPHPTPIFVRGIFFFQIISFCKDFFFQWELFKIHLHYFTTDKRAVIFNNENEVDTRTYPMLLERLKLSSIGFQVQLLFKIFEQTILIKLQITRKRTSHSCLQAYNIKQYKRKICIWWPIEACLYLM